MRAVCWFSCGAASAVASKLTVEKYGQAEVVYCDTAVNEHPDNERFLTDIEAWIGVKVRRIRSADYATVDEVFEKTRYMAGIAGARCTTELKKLPRREFEEPDDIHVFGYTLDEQSRIEDFEANNPELNVDWILRDQGYHKRGCLETLQRAGVRLPEMYVLGFDHNNCMGCVKATSPAYWNKTRTHFPVVFARRAKQSREIGARLVRVNGVRIFLDELSPNDLTDFSEDLSCGPQCGLFY